MSRVIETVCQLGKLVTLDADQDIYDAGVSSLQALGLLTELEDAFGVSIPDAEFVSARTPRALLQIIEAQRTG